MAGLTFILNKDAINLYRDGSFDFSYGYIYIAFITNCSQIWALYCLVLFYHSMHKEIQKIRPFAKFMCIKLVVFFTFWQGVGIAFLVYIGDIQSTTDYTADNVSGGIQDFIICIEMFLAALAHIYAFPYLEFSEIVVKKNTKITQAPNTTAVIAISDNDLTDQKDQDNSVEIAVSQDIEIIDTNQGKKIDTDSGKMASVVGAPSSPISSTQRLLAEPINPSSSSMTPIAALPSPVRKCASIGSDNLDMSTPVDANTTQ